jgi:hypothetical protein
MPGVLLSQLTSSVNRLTPYVWLLDANMAVLTYRSSISGAWGPARQERALTGIAPGAVSFLDMAKGDRTQRAAMFGAARRGDARIADGCGGVRDGDPAGLVEGHGGIGLETRTQARQGEVRG